MERIGAYVVAEHTCWRCERSILVYAWDKGLWEDAPPPEPIPVTVERRSTPALGDAYWVNVCAHCHAVQGDWYLYMEPDGPFFALEWNTLDGSSDPSLP